MLLALILRRPVTAWLPLIGTFVIVSINELVDVWVEIWPERGMQAGEAAKDVVTTVALPLLLCIAFRALPGLTASGPRAGGERQAAPDAAD